MQTLAIEILNLGIGNVESIANWVSRCGFYYEYQLGKDIYNHENNILIIPGVANSVGLMKEINKNENLKKKLKDKTYRRIVGICAGFHVLTNYIEDGSEKIKGLGLINARTRNMQNYRTGWAAINFNVKNSEHLRKKVYFNHGCAVYAMYGENEKIDMVIEDKIIGLQFHPEKSGDYGVMLGMEILNV